MDNKTQEFLQKLKDTGIVEWQIQAISDNLFFGIRFYPAKGIAQFFLETIPASYPMPYSLFISDGYYFSV